MRMGDGDGYLCRVSVTAFRREEEEEEERLEK